MANEHEIPKPQSEAIRVGRLLIVPVDFAAFLDGEEIDLSFKEFKLLLLLARNHGHVVTRDEVQEEVWDGNARGRSIDVTMARLRGKLPRGSIKTIVKVGFRLIGP